MEFRYTLIFMFHISDNDDDVPPELPLDSACDHEQGAVDIPSELHQDPSATALPVTTQDPDNCGPDVCDVESSSSSDNESGILNVKFQVTFAIYINTYASSHMYLCLYSSPFVVICILMYILCVV